MKTGRPPKYKTIKELQEKIDQYFIEVKEIEEDHPTLTGLALFLGFADRQSMYDYEKNEMFSCTIKKARTKIEQFYEKHLLKPGVATGAIFALKNFKWTDKQEIEHSGDMNININLIDD